MTVSAPPPEPPPNQTLFVGNIDHSLKRDELLHCLHELYTPFGPIVEIKIQRQDKETAHIGTNRKTNQPYAKPMRYMKTTAFVVFDSVTTAALAKTRTKNFQFFSRQLFVQFAKTTSDCVALLDGSHTYLKRQGAGVSAAMLSLKKEKGSILDEEELKLLGLSMNKDGTAASVIGGDRVAVIKKSVESVSAIASKNVGLGRVSNKVLVEGLIPEFTEEIMRPLFEQFPGLADFQHFPGRGQIKLEFETQEQAGCLIDELQGFNVDGVSKLKIKYG